MFSPPRNSPPWSVPSARLGIKSRSGECRSSTHPLLRTSSVQSWPTERHISDEIQRTGRQTRCSPHFHKSNVFHLLARPWKIRNWSRGFWGCKVENPQSSPVQNEACVARPRRVIQLQANAYASTPDYAPSMHGMAIIDPPCTSCRRLFRIEHWGMEHSIPGGLSFVHPTSSANAAEFLVARLAYRQGMDYALLQTQRAKPVGSS